MLSLFFKPYISAFLGIMCVILGFLSFGNANVFDRIFIAVAVLVALMLRKNSDVLGLICILVASRFFEEFIWCFDSHEQIIKILSYTSAILCIWRFWYDVCSKILLLTVIFSLSAELYWYTSAYLNTPAIYWHLFLMALYFLMKHLVFFRTAITLHFKIPAKPTVLDSKMMGIANWYVILDSVIVFDYIVRHTVWPIDYPVVYYAYPYIAQAIATYILWLIFEESHYFLAERMYKV